MDFLEKLPNLIYCSIGNFDHLESLEGIKCLKHIEYLALENNKNLVNYDEIETLTTLNYLSIDGGVTRIYKLGSLNFLKKLDLYRLDLGNVSVNKNNLQLIASLKNLQKLGLAINFKVEEIAYLILFACNNQQGKNTPIPQPHKNFYGKWKSDYLTVFITPDSITIWNNYDARRVVEIPDNRTGKITAIKNTALEYELHVDPKKGFTQRHPFRYDPATETLFYGETMVPRAK